MSRTIKDLPSAVRVQRSREIVERSQARRTSDLPSRWRSERSSGRLRQGHNGGR